MWIQTRDPRGSQTTFDKDILTKKNKVRLMKGRMRKMGMTSQRNERENEEDGDDFPKIVLQKCRSCFAERVDTHEG